MNEEDHLSILDSFKEWNDAMSPQDSTIFIKILFLITATIMVCLKQTQGFSIDFNSPEESFRQGPEEMLVRF